MIRESIDAGGVLDFLDRLAEADLLHVDDLGAEHRTEWVLEQLYSIINTRYEEQRATLVTRTSTTPRCRPSSASGSSPAWRACAGIRCPSTARTPAG